MDFSSDSIEAHGTSISQVRFMGYIFDLILVIVFQHLEILQVVYTGLHIVNPLITLDMLKYPKLCHDVSFSF